jgi:hypothetical protein
MSNKPISDLRRRMIADMTIRTFSDKTQRDYIRHIEAFASFSAARPTLRPATTSAASSSHRSSRARSHRR